MAACNGQASHQETLHEGKKKDVTEETKEGNEVRHVRTYAELEGAGRHRQEETQELLRVANQTSVSPH